MPDTPRHLVAVPSREDVAGSTVRPVAPTPGPVAALQRTVVKAVMRLAVRPAMAAPGWPVARRRAVMEIAARLGAPAPRGTRVVDGLLGGVETEHVTHGRPTTDRHVLFLHGGGYVVGSPRTHRAYSGALARALGATVHVPDYRLAPEHPHPAATQDALAAWGDLLDDGVAPDRLVVAGDSAGGGLALAFAVAAREAGMPLPAALVLFSPWVDLTQAAPSHRERAPRDPVLGDLRNGFNEMYAGPLALDDPAVSPLFADLAGLPPTLVQVGSEEVLHDDAVRLAVRLADAGGVVEAELWDAQWHDWHTALLVHRDAGRAFEHVAAFVDQHVPR